MLKAKDLHGILPAIPTPVRADDTLDEGALAALFSWLLKQGIDGVVPLGGTGEYGALARSERIRTVRHSVEAMKGQGPVIAGVLDTGFHDALQATRDFAEVGADAVLALTPYYTNATQAGIRDYFLRLADTAPLPILLYEIPYRTRIAINPAITHELSRYERIIGMKVCNTDMYHYLQVVAGVHEDFTVPSGEDNLFPLHVAAGAKGGIVVTANLLPRAWRAIYEAARAGRTEEALALHRRLIPFMNMAFAETNPGPMKAVMDLVGVDAPRMLAPLVEPAPELAANLRRELEAQLAISEGIA